MALFLSLFATVINSDYRSQQPSKTSFVTVIHADPFHVSQCRFVRVEGHLTQFPLIPLPGVITSRPRRPAGAPRRPSFCAERTESFPLWPCGQGGPGRPGVCPRPGKGKREGEPAYGAVLPSAGRTLAASRLRRHAPKLDAFTTDGLSLPLAVISRTKRWMAQANLCSGWRNGFLLSRSPSWTRAAHGF